MKRGVAFVRSVIVVLGLGVGLPGTAAAAPVTSIGDIDVGGLSFEVTSLVNGTVSGFSVGAAGTANTIGWSAAVDAPGQFFNYNGYTCTNNCYTPPALPGAPATDRLHASQDFTINFADTINWFLVAFSNDSPQLGGFDFGLAPAQVGGNVSVSGTRLVLTGSAGGWALFTGLSTDTLSHTNWYTPLDGYHIAWFAGQDVAPVPLPAAAWLLLSGLAGVGLLGRRRAS